MTASELEPARPRSGAALAHPGAGSSPSPGEADRLRHPLLGRRLFGYSRHATHELLDAAAAAIEQLRFELGRAEHENGRLTAAVAEVEERERRLLAVLASTKAELEWAASARLATADEEKAIGQALVTAQRSAAQIVNEAQQEARSLLAGAEEAAARAAAATADRRTSIRTDAGAFIAETQEAIVQLASEMEHLVRRLEQQRKLLDLHPEGAEQAPSDRF